MFEICYCSIVIWLTIWNICTKSLFGILIIIMLIKTANSLVFSKVRVKKIEPINTKMRSIDGNACEQHINQKPLIMFWLCYYSFNTELIVISLNAPYFTWYSSWWWLDSPLGRIIKLFWITQAEHVCTREFAHFYDKFDFTTYFSMRCCHVHHRQGKKRC